jgi:hypothetical protein
LQEPRREGACGRARTGYTARMLIRWLGVILGLWPVDSKPEWTALDDHFEDSRLESLPSRLD